MKTGENLQGRTSTASLPQPPQHALRMNLSGGAFLTSSSQAPRGHTTPMPRKITAAAPGLDFIYCFPVSSAQGGGSTGGRMYGGKYQKGRVLQSLGGALEIFAAPTFRRSPGTKLKAGGRGEKSLQLTE